jgi:predicted  nucleic acid-binding Zn-ribbon protein
MMSSTTTVGIDFPNDSLEQANKSTLVSIINGLTSKLNSVKSELADVREDADRLSRTVANTRGEVSEIREDTERVSKELADTNSRVSDLEENTNTDVSQSSEGQSSPDESQGSDSQSTALEQVVGLPDDVAMNSLSANQKRARSIAKRVDEYGKSVPAGIAITSSRMRDILSGLEDKRVHRQTVQRVMDFLKRFGDGHIDTKETRGGKTVTVFSETVVESITSVVTGESRDGVTPALIS